MAAYPDPLTHGIYRLLANDVIKTKSTLNVVIAQNCH